MDYFYDDYSEEEENKPRPLNIKKILIGVFVVLIILFLLLLLSPSSRYRSVEKEMVKIAQKYVNNNLINVEREVYLDVKTLDYNLNDKCSEISGVFYDGNNYTPYLYCTNYESDIIDNSNDTISLYGKEVIILIKDIFFIDPGFDSKYNVSVIGEVGNEEGVYTIHYFDNDNNNVITRKVVVIDNKDLLNSVPSISLNGNDVVHIFKGESYNEEGVIAKDINDGDITDDVTISGKVNTDEIGQYPLVYMVTNRKGLTNCVLRKVNVVNEDMSIQADYLITPTTIVNTNVNISISITGNDYDYTILPNNTKVIDNYISYKVDKNGTYTFLIYDRAGRIITKEVKITNIDKDLPIATCDAVIYNNYTNIVVNTLSLKNISSYEYQIDNYNKKSISSTLRYDAININNASVIINDSAGNKNTVKCEKTFFNDWKTDYSKSLVFIKSDTSKDILKKYTLDNYMMGVIYKELINEDLSVFSNEQLIHLFKTYFILKKAEIFRQGGYDINLKQLVFNIYDGNNCDVYTGCKYASKNGKNFYLSNDIDYSVDNVLNVKDKLSDDIISIMKDAYNETKKYIITSSNYKQVLTNYNDNFTLTDTMKENIISEIKNDNRYDSIISKLFRNYQIYDISNYANKYVENKVAFYFPIGSSSGSSGIYNGTPESVSLIHNYGASLVDNKIYDYVAIKGECHKTNVISASSGVVVDVNSNSEYGHFITIDHGGGVKFIYGSLDEETIAVNIGTTVRKGQLIGKVDKINSECMLYVKSSINDVVVNPMNYISTIDTRPANGESIIYVPGNTVKESVCKSLVTSGISVNATAGIMANMDRESKFKLEDISDGGTSYGLCQWHASRWNSLSNYCGSRTNTAECQLQFLFYEMKNNYKTVYSYVMGSYSAYDIGYKFCRSYEQPAGGDTSCQERGRLAENTYVSYVVNGCQ